MIQKLFSQTEAERHSQQWREVESPFSPFLLFIFRLFEITHPLFDRAAALTGKVIGAVIEVHKHFGPGLLESVYEWALIRELTLLGCQCSIQRAVQITYKGDTRQDELKYDLLVDECLLVEVKAVESVLPIHKAQLVSYLKLLNVPLAER